MQDKDNLQLASLGSRAFAAIIDELLVTFIIVFMFWDSFVIASSNTENMMHFVKVELVTPLILLKVIYHTVFTWYYGATIGKIIFKIRIIDAYTWERVSILSAFFRSIGRIFSEMFFYVGFLIGFFNDGRKTFHDITGKTLVVNA